MRLALLLLALLAVEGAEAGKRKSKKKKKGRSAIPPSAAPAAPGPAAVTSPWESRLADATATDSSEELDLERLAYVITTFRIDADLSGLDGYVGDSVETLVRHLAADPRWKVMEWDGALVAFKRTAASDGWTIPRSGYHAQGDNAWRAVLRFDEWGEDSAWPDSKLVSRALANDTGMKIKAFRLENRPDLEAIAVSWQAEGLWFEVFEASKKTTLSRTSEELAFVPGYLQAATLDGVQQRGFSEVGLPADEPVDAPSSLSVEWIDGELEVRARVHAPGPGISWVRLLDGDGNPWEEGTFAAATREVVGWSTETLSFYMQGRVPTTPPSEKQDMVGEVWHLARNSRKPERIGAWRVMVPAG